MVHTQLLPQLRLQKRWLKAADEMWVTSEGHVFKGVAATWPLPGQHVLVLPRRSLPFLTPGFAPKDVWLHDLSGKLHQQASLLECMKPEILQDCYLIIMQTGKTMQIYTHSFKTGTIILKQTML